MDISRSPKVERSLSPGGGMLEPVVSKFFSGGGSMSKKRLNWSASGKNRSNRQPQSVIARARANSVSTSYSVLLSDSEYSDGTLLLRDCARGSADAVRKRLSTNPSLLHFQDYDFRTALHVAASEGDDKIVGLLLELGANPNLSDRWGGAPLDDAQRAQSFEAVALLQRHGGVGGVRDANVELALACSRGNVERARRLVDEGADVHALDYDQRTPLHIAASAGHADVCRALLALGAHSDGGDRWGRTPLDEAVRRGHEGCAAALREVGAAAGGVPDSPLVVPAVSPALEHMSLDYSASSMEVDWADVTVIERIGMGAFGEIFKCRWRGSLVAAKRMKVRELDSSLDAKQARSDFKKEIELLLHMRHPNICLLLGYSLTAQHEVMLSELMKCSLQDVMKATGGAPLALQRAFRYAIQFVQGMAYLHTCKPPVLHRDLKPANLLLDFSDTLKVADFGLARLRNPRSEASVPSEYVPYVMTGETGSYRYMAPEVFRHEKYGRPVDVYSFSLILYFMLVGTEPWEQTDGALAVELAATKNDRPIVPRHVSSRLQNLMRVAWDDNPVNRPSFPALLDQLNELYARQFNETFEQTLQLGRNVDAAASNCECVIL